MDSIEFKRLRKRLSKTQKQMAQLLGVSLKAIHSYEQGWRVVPPAVERQVYFLISRLKALDGSRPCWELKGCLPDHKAQCPAFEFNSGAMCWFINGTACNGVVHSSWEEKMAICRTCDVFTRQVAT